MGLCSFGRELTLTDEEAALLKIGQGKRQSWSGAELTQIATSQ